MRLLLLLLIHLKLAFSLKSDLNAKHLIIFPQELPTLMDLKRNSSGFIIAMDGYGLPFINQLATGLNFTYEYLQANYTVLNETGRTPISYLLAGVITQMFYNFVEEYRFTGLLEDVIFDQPSASASGLAFSSGQQAIRLIDFLSFGGKQLN